MSLAMDAVRIRPLSPVLAAEVIGLDLSQPLDEPTRRDVYAAFVRYQVLCFRDQRLSKDQQIAFTEQFGTLERHIARNRGTDNPLVHTVSNLGPDGKPSGKVGSQEWHTDKSFRPEPSMATILHAVTMPPLGGDTCFADMYAAYEALSEDAKTELDGVRVIHSWEQSQQKHGRTATPEEIADAPPMSSSAGPRASGQRSQMPVHGRACLALRWASDVRRPRTYCDAGGACDAGPVRLSAHVASRRHADVGQPLPVASRRRELRRRPVPAGASPDVPARNRAGVSRAGYT